jgi:hypothetical protein
MGKTGADDDDCAHKTGTEANARAPHVTTRKKTLVFIVSKLDKFRKS